MVQESLPNPTSTRNLLSMMAQGFLSNPETRTTKRELLFGALSASQKDTFGDIDGGAEFDGVPGPGLAGREGLSMLLVLYIV